MEETVMDHRMGGIVNRNLGEYHEPVNAHVLVIEPFIVEEMDPHVNPFGAKGIGEIAIVGVAAVLAETSQQAADGQHGRENKRC